MRKVQRRLAIDTRKSMKQAIYLRNRRYAQLVETSIAQNFKLVQTSRDIDPGYLTVIETLKRKRYDRDQILNLIELLDHQDFLQVYKGVIGLGSFDKRAIVSQNQEGFMGSGIVPKLVQLIRWREHPYIQKACLQLLNHITKSINPQNLRAFCNMETIPFALFIEAINFPQNIFNLMLSILKELNQRGNYIDSSDASLLDRIDQLISRDQSQWLPKIKMICRLLDMIKVYFWSGRRHFANKYYDIRDKLLSIFIAKDMTKDVLREMQMHNDRDKIKSICTAINNHPTQVPAVAVYIRKLVQNGFQLNFGKTSTFSFFLSIIIAVKQSKHIFTTRHLLGLIQGVVFKIDIKSNYLKSSQSYKLQECVNALYYIMHSEGDNYREIQERKTLFSNLFQLYKYYEKNIICQLNLIVRFMVNHSSKAEFMTFIRDFELIDKYFKNCNRFNQMTAKGALKYMMWSLCLLKRKEPQQYEIIRKMVVTDQNYKIINQIKTESYLSNIQQIFQFYQKLKEEIKISPIQPAPSYQISNNNPVTTLQNSNNKSYSNSSMRSSSSNQESNYVMIQEEPQHNLIQISESSEIPQNEQIIIVQHNRVVIDVDVIIIDDQ